VFLRRAKNYPKKGFIKINSTKENFKTRMTYYEDGKLIRRKGRVIARKHDFIGAVGFRISPIKLWHV
jgi:hypothetical protein